jgi:muramoyltetrapeptide carboxypeptidase
MRIGVVAPASIGNKDAEAPFIAFAALAYPEVDLVVHPQCWEVAGHFAGDDARRASAFLEFANDPGFDAIWFLRGGYGSNRILPLVMPQLAPAARHKSYLGYSDMGFLLGALYARRIGRPAHGRGGRAAGRYGNVAAAAATLPSPVRSAGSRAATGRGWSRASTVAPRRRSTCRSSTR